MGSVRSHSRPPVIFFLFYPEVVNFLWGFNVFGLRAGLSALRIGPYLPCFPGLLWEIVLKICKENMFLTEKPQRSGVYGSMGVFRRNRNPEEDLAGSSHSHGKGAKDFQSLRNR